jgi:hypothetical protein
MAQTTPEKLRSQSITILKMHENVKCPIHPTYEIQIKVNNKVFPN